MARLVILLTCFFLLSFLSLVKCQPRKSPSRRPPFGKLAREIIRNNSLAANLGVGRLARLQRSVFEESKCEVRLCFALDGSDTITRADYELEKDLVNIIASVAAIDDASFSAVQFGIVNSLISPKTGNATEFRFRVEDSEYMNSDGSFIGAGLGFCISDVKDERARDGRVVVLLGDGRGQFTDTFLKFVLGAVETEKLFAIGVGRKQSVANLRRAVGGKSRNVLSIRRNGDAEKVVEEIVQRICNLD